MATEGSHAEHAKNLRILLGLLWASLGVLVPLYGSLIAFEGRTSDGEPIPTATRLGQGLGGLAVAAVSSWLIIRYIRSSTAFDASGVTMRGVLRPRHVPWQSVTTMLRGSERGVDANAPWRTVAEYRTVRLYMTDGSHRRLPGVTVTKRWEASLDEVFDAARPFASLHGVVLPDPTPSPTAPPFPPPSFPPPSR